MATAWDHSTTAGSNSTVGGVDIAEGTMVVKGTNNMGRAILADFANALKAQGGAYTTTGTGSAYTLTLDIAPTAYAESMLFLVKFHAVSASTTPTINVNALGAKTIVLWDGSALPSATYIPVNSYGFIKYDGTNFRVLLPFRRDLEVITSGSASSVAALDFTDLSADYRAYLLVFDHLQPATDTVILQLRTSSDNGSNFNAGASDYAYVRHQASAAGSDGTSGSGTANTIELVSNVGNGGAGFAISGRLLIVNPMEATSHTRTIFDASHADTSANMKIANSAGRRVGAEANNAIRLLFSSGNISTIIYTLYGLRAS